MKIAETQTEASTDVPHETICCLNGIPYVDQSMTPPVVHRVTTENCNGGENHVESKNPFLVDNSTTVETTNVQPNQLDNGDVQHDVCENSIEVL